MIYDKSTESLFQLVSQKNISNSIFEKSVVGYPVVIYFLYSDYMYITIAELINLVGSNYTPRPQLSDFIIDSDS